MPSPRRFPPPWSASKLERQCIIVPDANGQALACIYFEDEPGRRCAISRLEPDELQQALTHFLVLTSVFFALQLSHGRSHI
jgi:hypothetical protein